MDSVVRIAKSQFKKILRNYIKKIYHSLVAITY